MTYDVSADLATFTAHTGGPGGPGGGHGGPDGATGAPTDGAPSGSTTTASPSA